MSCFVLDSFIDHCLFSSLCSEEASVPLKSPRMIVFGSTAWMGPNPK